MADGTVKIDLLFPANKQKFHSDTKLVEDLLKRIGEGTGDQMDDSFNENTNKMSDKASSTSKHIKDEFADPVKQKLEGDDSNLSEKVASAKASLEKLPDETLTRLKAEAEDAGVTDFDKLLEALPEEEITELLAKAEKGEVINFDELLDSLPEETRTELKAKAERGEIVSFDKLIKDVPRKKVTDLKADAETHGINNFDKLLKRIPKKYLTKLEAMAEKGEVINYEELLNQIPKRYLTNLELNDNASPGLRHIQEEAEETGSKFSHLKEIIAGSFLGNALSGAFSMATSGLHDMVGEAMSASDAMQGFQATMELAGKSSKTIKSVGKDVKEYADTTVYDLKDVSSTTAQLAANGVKGYEKLTEAAGNLTAVAGGTKEDFKSITMVMTQTAGAGKLTTENWNQLTDAIPGASGKLQEAMKKNGAYTGNFRDAMADGKISADDFNKAIEEIGMTDKAKEYAKGTAAFEGAFGHLKTEVVNGLKAIIDAIGKSNITGAINGLAGGASKAFGLIVKAVGPVKRAFSDLGKIISPIGKIIGTIAKGAFSVFADIIGDVVDGIKSLKDNAKDSEGPVSAIAKTLEKLADHQKALTLVGKAIGIIGTALFALKGTAKIVDGVTTALTAIPKVIGGISGAFDLLGASLLLNPITWIAGIIIGVGLAFYEAYKHIKPFRDAVNKVGKAIKEGLGKAFAWIKKNWKHVGSYIVNPVGTAISDLYKHNPKFRKWADSAVRGIKVGFESIGKWFSNLWGGITKGAKKGWKAIKKAVSFGAEMVKAVALAPIVLIASVIVAVWNSIKKPTTKFWNWMKSKIGGIAKTIKNTVTGWFNALKKSVTSIWNGIKFVTAKVWNPVKKIILNTAKIIWKGVKNTFNALKKSISHIWGGVKYITHKVWNPLHDWLGRKSGQIGKTVSGKFTSLKKGLGNIMGDISKKWKRTWNGIADFFKGIWKSIKRHAKNGMKGVIGFLNGGIGGINKVIHTFGGPRKAIHEIGKLKTGGSGYKGIAQVNDGNGEEAILKGGQAYKVTGKNAYVNLEGDETVVPYEASRSMFGESIAHYAGGSKNWFSNLTGWFKDKWDGIVNFIKHPLKSLENIMSKAMGAISGSELVTNLAPALGKGLVRGIESPFKKMLQKLKDKHDEDEGGVDIKGTATPAQAKKVIKHAMKIAGVSGSNWLNGLSTIAKYESGFRNVTNHTDSNAAKGTPSSGWFQMIKPTFKAHAKAGYGSWTKPLDQAISVIGYIKSKYGGIGNVPGLVSLAHGGGYKPYANGGFANQPSIFGEKGLEAAVPLSAEKADQGYAMLGKSAAYMAQRDSLTISNGQTNGRLDKVEQGLLQAVLLLNQINTTSKNNVKATYATAFDKQLLYKKMAAEQSMASYQGGVYNQQMDKNKNWQ